MRRAAGKFETPVHYSPLPPSKIQHPLRRAAGIIAILDWILHDLYAISTRIPGILFDFTLFPLIFSFYVIFTGITVNFSFRDFTGKPEIRKFPKFLAKKAGQKIKQKFDGAKIKKKHQKSVQGAKMSRF